MRAAIMLVLALLLTGCGSCGTANPIRARGGWFTLESGDFRNAPLREGPQRIDLGGERTVRVEAAPAPAKEPQPAVDLPAPSPVACSGDRCTLPLPAWR